MVAPAAFTFLSPILQQISGFTPNQVSLLLLVYGVSVAVGNLWGGRLADRLGPVPALRRLFAGLVTAPHPGVWCAATPTACWASAIRRHSPARLGPPAQGAPSPTGPAGPTGATGVVGPLAPSDCRAPSGQPDRRGSPA